ncbi:MAG: hypothetical protein ABR564_04915, partial [Candidatus Dormibacteria bacterium]
RGAAGSPFRPQGDHPEKRLTVGPGGDSAADALAAQVRRYRLLTPLCLAELVLAAREDPSGDAAHRLAEHHLGIALDEAVDRTRAPASLEDLFQEGALAVVAAVSDFIAGEGDPEDLPARIREKVRGRLDESMERLETLRRADESFAIDAARVDATVIQLRRSLHRPASAEEVAAALEWSTERVALVSDLIRAARARDDEEITAYLDDEG